MVAGDKQGDPYMLTSRHAKATKHDSRRSNLRTTLELVSHRGATSRAEIARQTGLTRAAVSSLVGELMDQGLLRSSALEPRPVEIPRPSWHSTSVGGT